MDEALLAQTIRDYGVGLEAEVDLLGRIGDLAVGQRTASAENRLADVSRIGDEREHLLAELVRLEQALKPQRALLAAHLARASKLPGFAALAARHRQARQCVETILGADDTTIGQLQDAEQALRASAQVLDAGEATLAAYRRVVSPLIGNALVSRRG